MKLDIVDHVRGFAHFYHKYSCRSVLRSEQRAVHAESYRKLGSRVHAIALGNAGTNFTLSTLSVGKSV